MPLHSSSSAGRLCSSSDVSAARTLVAVLASSSSALAAARVPSRASCSSGASRRPWRSSNLSAACCVAAASRAPARPHGLRINERSPSTLSCSLTSFVPSVATSTVASTPVRCTSSRRLEHPKAPSERSLLCTLISRARMSICAIFTWRSEGVDDEGVWCSAGRSSCRGFWFLFKFSLGN